MHKMFQKIKNILYSLFFINYFLLSLHPKTKKRLCMKRFLPLLLVALTACHATPTPEPDQPQQDLPEANQTVIYECNERLFAKSQCFSAIQAYLPVLQEMNVNVLWLMPIHPRGTVKSVGSPYCVRNFLSIDPAFGKEADLRALVDDAHNRGMRVILDWVANHTAWDHPWVENHPDWYTEAQTADEQLWNDVAFLDYSVEAVVDSMTACMLYWVREFGIDGFRCDYAHGVPSAFWRHAISAVRAERENALFIAETSQTAYYEAGFDLLYSWNYLGAIQNLYAGQKTFKDLLTISKREYNTTPEGKERMRYITTHDASSENAPSSFYKNASSELSAFCLTIFLGGIPMIYSSQEIGYMSKINFFNYQVMNFSAENKVTKRLIALNRAYRLSAHLRTGTQSTGTLADNVPFIEYTVGDSALLVVCNTLNQKITVTYPASYQGKTVIDLINSTSETLPASAELAAYEYRVLKR